MGGAQCDGLGNCVECLAPTDCAGTDDACRTRACTQGKCGFDFAADGTDLPVQTVGDCKQAVCDGDGCSEEACNAGVPSHPTKANGSACNDTKSARAQSFDYP